jgi:hypothetical protein
MNVMASACRTAKRPRGVRSPISIEPFVRIRDSPREFSFSPATRKPQP